MTTIGTAVLQIIPSLRGVSEAIEKQIDGKVVEVKVAPKVDQAATKKAGKDAGETIAKEAKAAVSKGELGKAVTEDLKNSVQKSGAGKDVAKILVDDLGVGVKQGVKAGDLGGTIKDAVLPTITQIGSEIRSGAAQWSSNIAAALRSGDIQGAAGDVTRAIEGTTGIISGLGEAFGIQTDGLRDSSDIAVQYIGNIGGSMQAVVDKGGSIKSTIEGAVAQFGQLGDAATLLSGKDFGKGTKFGNALSSIGEAAGPIGLSVAAMDQLDTVSTQFNLNKWTEAPGSGLWFIHQLKEGLPALQALGAANRANDALNAAVANARADAANRGPSPAFPGDHSPTTGGGRAFGGMIPGFSTRDDRLGLIAGRSLIGLAGGEGIINARATRNLGGASTISWLNGFADGGIVPPDVAAAQALAGTGYSQGARTDCSGMVARVIDRTLGMPEAGLMSTKTAADWLAARGFIPGSGGAGQISVGWYDHGPNPNDGHMAMTLSDGRNAEAGGSNGVFTIGGSAAGASSPQFDQHMHLPTVYGEGPAGSASAASSPFAGGSASAAATSAAPTISSSGGGAAAAAVGGGGPLPTSITGLSSWGLADLKGPETGPGKRQFEYGTALSDAVTGQVSSALGVLGVPDSPNWLKGISNVIGQIKVGGHDPSGVSDGSIFDGSNLFGGGSAAPLAASPTATGATPDDPGNMHGSRAGQQPGVVNNWTINARDTEDAFVKAQRVEREKAAAKLSRF